METGFLVAAHLCSLVTSQVISIPLRTSRQGVPIPATSNDLDTPAEHAIQSSILHTSATGTILLRVLHGGFIIELVSLSVKVPPIRIIFPSAVLSSPAVYLWSSSELHVLAVTEIGSLYRIGIPIVNERDLWRNQSANIWTREHLLRNIPDANQSLVHVHGTHCVVIGSQNGSLVRLENDYSGEGNRDDWIETVFQQGSFLSSLTSLLPLSGNNTAGSEIISIATHPLPTDIGHVWTLSRDRTVRFWKAKIGCVASKSLSLKESSPSPSGSNNSRSHTLLEPSSGVALRVFTQHGLEEHLYVIAFTPVASSPSSGGTFHLLDTVGDHIYELGKIEASHNTAHCHLQDFAISGNSLIVLWDRQGNSLLEKTVIDVHRLTDGSHTAPWHTSRSAPEPELTPAYLEELLLSPGSMIDRFFDAIMRPGTFSALSLQLAIDQYVDACLSIPGPRPPQLTMTYSSLGERIAAVVGCTVNLNRDPQTGAYQHANYWSALKRDWEGFIARCREVERNARRPLALGIRDEGEIIVVERERAGSVVPEDFPIRLQRLLLLEQTPNDPQYELLTILWTLKNKLGPELMLNLEKRVMEIIQQEVAFAMPDILRDQTSQFNLRDSMDEAFMHWMIGRLQSINDLDAAMRAVLDVIGGFDVEVKQEEDEVGLLLPPPHSNWARALVAAYVIRTVDARYGLALTLMTLLFFLSDEVSEWDPSLLAEIFAVFRGIAILHYVTKRPAGTMTGNVPDLAVGVMTTRTDLPITPTLSLVDHLLDQFGHVHGPPGAAHRFLDSTGLLQSISPANATRSEVLFCERLRLLGFRHASRELVSWLPKTPGISYVQARLWLDLDRADDASYLFEKLAGCFAGVLGGNQTLSTEDQEALASVLPAADLLESQYSFYVHVSTLLQNSSWAYHEVLFAQRAISVAPSAADTSSLWGIVIKGLIDLSLYEDAYASLMSSPYEKLRRECASQLTYRMCDDDAVDRLLGFNFSGLADEVEDALAFKSRNADPRIHPPYSRILYNWYVNRGDYRNAALAMLQRARKLQDLIVNATSFVSIAEEQLEAYNLAINALSLVDEKNAWVLFPTPTEQVYDSQKWRKLSRRIPVTRTTHEKLGSDVVHLADIRYEYALLAARSEITLRDPTLSSISEYLLPPSVIVLRLAHANRFTLAMFTARSLNLDMSDLFSHLTRQCLRLSQNSDAVIQEDASDWLLTDEVLSWTGTLADRGWRYLRQSLQQNDSADNDYKYTKTALETILSAGSSSSPPPWLIQTLEEHHHEYLIRVSLRFENLEAALDYTLSLVRKSEARLARDVPHDACSTWLPYSLIEQVLVTAADVSTPRTTILESAISSRIKRMQKLSQISK